MPSGAGPTSLLKKEAFMAERTVGDPHGSVTRRGFLSRIVTFGVAACGGGGLLGPVASWAQGNREIKFSHGTGLCNMPLFYAAEKKLFAKYAIESNVVLSGWAGDQAIQLATGKVEMSAIEPYATRGLMATKGNVLGDGVDMYGPGYPDCVLIARKELIDKEPKVVKDVIRVFFEAEAEIETNFEEAAKTTIGKYYKT